MITISFVKRTLQSLSQSIPIPKRLCRKAGMIWPNRSGGMSCNVSMQEAEESWGWPVAVPTRICWACGLTLETGAFGVRYHPLAPESTIAVSRSSKIAWSRFLILRAVRFSNFRRHFWAILADLHNATNSVDFGNFGVTNSGWILFDKRATGLRFRFWIVFRLIVFLVLLSIQRLSFVFCAFSPLSFPPWPSPPLKPTCLMPRPSGCPRAGGR